LCDGKRDLIAEERPQIPCDYDLEENQQGFGSGLIMLAATNQKAGRVKRRQQRLDRLSSYYREAA
jgi:hypothetical protein